MIAFSIHYLCLFVKFSAACSIKIPRADLPAQAGARGIFEPLCAPTYRRGLLIALHLRRDVGVFALLV